MKSYLFIFIISLGFLNVSCSSGGGDSTPTATTSIDIAGVWTITETDKSSNCTIPPILKPPTDLTVTQNGSSITIVDDENNTFTGTLNGSNLTWTGSYADDAPDGTAGIVTLNPMTAVIDASCNSLTGTANWTWTATEGPAYSCTGTTQFTGSRTPASGCGVADPTNPTDTTALTHASLNGTWATICGIIDPVSSNKIVFVFNDGVGSGAYTTYNDNLCSPLNIITVEPATFTYIFGSNVTVDGSVSGITTATQVDITETTQGSAGEITYDIGAIKDSTTLYLGDDSGTNDGSTTVLRPTQLDGLFPLTKL
jgi:hypothetical protein